MIFSTSRWNRRGGYKHFLDVDRTYSRYECVNAMHLQASREMSNENRNKIAESWQT